MKRIKNILAIILCFTVVFVTGCSFTIERNNPDDAGYSESQSAQDDNGGKTGNEQQEFDEFTNSLFSDAVTTDYLTLHSFLENPEKYGITDYEVTLGGYDIEKLDSTSDITDALSKLDGFKRESLSKDQQLTYDVLKKYLENNLEYSDLYMFDTELSTTIGIQVQLPLILAEYSFKQEKDVENYITLLEDTDNYFTKIIDYETLRSENGYFMDNSAADEIIGQCDSFISEAPDGFLIDTFSARLNSLEMDEQKKQDYIKKNKAAVSEHVVKGYEILKEGIQKLRGTGKYSGGLSNYPDGKRYYEYILKSKLGWSKSIEEYDELLDKYININVSQMQQLLKKDQSLMQQFTEFSFGDMTPEEILLDLKKKMKDQFPDGPDINYEVKNIDSSLKDYASPAMYFIPQIDNISENSIYLNLGNNTDDMYPTLAHEGFPGHMYQTTYFSDKSNSLIRHLIEPGGYLEGWATYIESISYTYADGQSEELKTLERDNYNTIMCMYGKIDIGVNYKSWDSDDVFNYIKQYGYNDKETAKSIYEAMISEPGNYNQYVLGMVGILELKQEAKNRCENKFDIKKFHQYFLDKGPVQFDILFRDLDEFVNMCN